MEFFTIVGTGMGLKETILPDGKKAIEEADLLIAGERNLEPWKNEDKEFHIIKSNLKETMDLIQREYKTKKIVVLVSGDPGFYSLLNYISKFFNRQQIKVIPGISSMQMAFSRVALSWHDAILLNLHGRDINTINPHKHSLKVGMLTDPINNALLICEHLIKQEAKNFTVFICSNLGYNDESVLEFKLYEYSKIHINPALPAVMILLDEEKNEL